MKFTARIVKGRGRGRTLGFPTFNLLIPPDLITKQGIYAGRVWLKGKPYLGAFHFGPIPTLADPKPQLEVFVLDYHSFMPLATLSFELLDYLRPIRNFRNEAELTRQISQDVAQTRTLLA